MKIQKRLGAVLLTAALLGSQLGTAAYPVYALESEPESMASAENLPSETELPMEEEPVSSEETLPQEELSSETAEFNEPSSETLPEEQTSVKVENSWRFQNGEPIPAVSDGGNRNSTSTNRWPEVSRATAKGVDVSRWHGEIDWKRSTGIPKWNLPYCDAEAATRMKTTPATSSSRRTARWSR